MRIISRRPIAEFCRRHPAATASMNVWWKSVEKARWESFADVKAQFNSIDAVGDGRIVFDIGGNKYRLIGRIAYAPYYRVLIKFVGTHAEYDRIDARTVDRG